MAWISAAIYWETWHESLDFAFMTKHGDDNPRIKISLSELYSSADVHDWIYWLFDYFCII